MNADASAISRYAAASVAAIALAGWLLSMAFSGGGADRALLLGGVVAAVVQVGAFMLARSVPLKHRIAGWGAGAGICLLTLIVFGFVSRATGMPAEPALLGMATYLFATELIEPFFLK